MDIYSCQECGKEAHHLIAFTNHLKLHGLNSKTYYDKFLKKPDDGMCSCGKPTKYMGFVHGYQKHCSNKCSSKESATKQWSGEVGEERKRSLSAQMTGNTISRGRPKGSKNKNPYPRTEAVENRFKNYTRTAPPHLHSAETKEKMSITRTRMILENGAYLTNKGFFKPRHPEKYKGNPSNIVYRSSWELKFMMFCDTHPDITQWSSEEIVVPYVDPVQGHRRRYFPDFVVWKKDGTVMMVEIKPYAQTQEPKVQSKKTKRYLTEVTTYLTNKAKWNAAEEFCAKRGWKFGVMTEKELFGKS